MKVRPLQEGDYDRGFLQLLSQLTSVGEVSRAEFLSEFLLKSIFFFNLSFIFLIPARFAKMKASSCYYVSFSYCLLFVELILIIIFTGNCD